MAPQAAQSTGSTETRGILVLNAQEAAAWREAQAQESAWPYSRISVLGEALRTMTADSVPGASWYEEELQRASGAPWYAVATAAETYVQRMTERRAWLTACDVWAAAYAAGEVTYQLTAADLVSAPEDGATMAQLARAESFLAAYAPVLVEVTRYHVAAQHAIQAQEAAVQALHTEGFTYAAMTDSLDAANEARRAFGAPAIPFSAAAWTDSIREVHDGGLPASYCNAPCCAGQ